MEEHINNITKIKKLKQMHKCDFNGCNKEFKKPSRLIWHIRQHTGEKPYKCDVKNCDKAYTTSSHLKRHVQSHNPIQKSLICDVCNKTLTTRSNLLRHHQRVHNSKSRLICKECGLTFRKKYKLEEHNAIHNNTLFTCEKCGKGFAIKSRLIRHIESHDRIRICPEEGCSEVFHRYIDLQKHKRLCHVKEYRCDECDKTFVHKSQQRQHAKVHRHILLHCPLETCNRVYAFQRNLNQHVLSKHQGRSFYCDMCGDSFTFKASLVRHIQKLHLNIIKSQKKSLKSPKKRKLRKDINLPKKSIAAKLAGVALSVDFEKIILTRNIIVQSNEEFQLINSTDNNLNQLLIQEN